MKDIFIDTNIACRFSNPMDPHLKDLLDWLMADGDEDNRAYLVVSKKLLREYLSSCRGAYGETSLPVLINKLTQEGRIENITNSQIQLFKEQYFTKTIDKKLRSNNEDRNHIPVVMLSERKLALTNDDNFTYDLTHFPGFTVVVSDRPEKIPYK